jgi:hypothetical protein
MLGRKSFTRVEVDAARAAVRDQLAAFATLGAPADVEPVYFNAMALALDRRFVHRVRMVTGKAGTPLNELELLTTALMEHGGLFTTDTVIKYDAGTAVVGLTPGDRVALSAEQFAGLAVGVFAELAEKFSE